MMRASTLDDVHAAFNQQMRRLADCCGREPRRPFAAARFFCASDTGGNVYQDDYRFVESLPGPSQFAEPHPDDAERFYSDLFEAGVAEGMRGFENVRRRCVLDLRANLSLTKQHCCRTS